MMHPQPFRDRAVKVFINRFSMCGFATLVSWIAAKPTLMLGIKVHQKISHVRAIDGISSS